jgi:hypothetical protein
MKIKELIKQLNKLAVEYGDINCSISIDTSNAFNVTPLDDVEIHRYEAQIDNVFEKHIEFADGTNRWEVCFNGELFLIDKD